MLPDGDSLPWLRTHTAGASVLTPFAERLQKAARTSEDTVKTILYSYLSTAHG